MFLKRDRQKINIDNWHKKIAKCAPELLKNKGELGKLRLILGPGRSGTTWLSNVIAKTATPISFIDEPLHPFKFKLPYECKYDHTATKYLDNIDLKNPVIQTLDFCTQDYSVFSQYINKKRIIRNDLNSKFVLIKEVHSLLATEGIIKFLKVPTVFITRNPIAVVDSLLSFRGISAPIWRQESRYMRDMVFLKRIGINNESQVLKYLKRYSDNGITRKSVIYGKILTVALLNRMFEVLNELYLNTIHITYEDLCIDSEKVFRQIADFLNFDFDIKMIGRESCSKSDDPYSINRDTSKQINKPLKFIKNKENEEIRSILGKCELF